MAKEIKQGIKSPTSSKQSKDSSTKEKSETKKEIIEDIEKSGVSEKVAKVEEALDEKEQLKGKELAKVAEAESTSKELEEKKKKLLEKAKKFAEKLSKETLTTEDLKEKVKIKKRTDMLVPLEEYVKTGIYLGTRVVTPNMKPFV